MRNGMKRPIMATLMAPVLMLSFGSLSAARAETSWADSVRAHLLAQHSPAPDAPATPVGVATPVQSHPVTAWARSVEQRLALRAQRVAAVGRSALAWSEEGIASWYGGRRAGHRTSSGERFDPMQLTCAHPTLPIGTKVLVTSQTTGRSVVVTVNDRGPFGGRIIDLSRAAAARIGMLGSGTASVTLQQASPEIVEVAEAADNDTSAQAIQVAANDDGAADDVSPSPRGRRHTRHGSR